MHNSERDVGRLLEWMEQAKEQIQDLTSQVGELVDSQKKWKTQKESVRLAIFAGLLAAICALVIVCLVANPSSVKEILPLLIEFLKSASGVSQ